MPSSSGQRLGSVIMLLALGGAILLLIFIAGFSNGPDRGPVTVSLGGRSYSVLLATNSAEWERGLMNYGFSCVTPDDCINGMLFVFPDNGNWCFWMKDTPQPLYQIWIRNGSITNVYKGRPENTTTICAYGNEVLELYSRLPVNASLNGTVSVK